MRLGLDLGVKPPYEGPLLEVWVLTGVVFQAEALEGGRPGRG